MRLSRGCVQKFLKRRKFLLRRCRTRAQRSAAAELLRQGDFSRLRLFGFDSNAAFFKKSRADERNVLSVRLARSARAAKNARPSRDALDSSSVVFRRLPQPNTHKENCQCHAYRRQHHSVHDGQAEHRLGLSVRAELMFGRDQRRDDCKDSQQRQRNQH